MKLSSIFAVLWRHMLTYRKLMWPVLSSNVATPLLYLFSFGFGLGAVIPVMSDSSGFDIPYMQYVLPGLLAYTVMFAASFESSISAYTRMAVQQNWEAVLSAPISLHELLLGEIFWATLKSMIAAVAVLGTGYFFDAIPSGFYGLLNIPVMFCSAFVFSSCALLSTSYAKSYEQFSYFFTFWITPMFMFSGVFFPVDRFPDYVQWVTAFFPMTYVLDVARPISTGTPLELWVVVRTVMVLAFMAGLTYFLTYRKVKSRLFN